MMKCLVSASAGCIAGVVATLVIKKCLTDKDDDDRLVLKRCKVEKLLELRDGYIAIQGKLDGKDGAAVVIIRSVSPESKDVAGLIADLNCKRTHHNDIYTDFEAFGSSQFKVRKEKSIKIKIPTETLMYL